MWMRECCTCRGSRPSTGAAGHPEKKAARSVLVNGKNGTDFDAGQEWIRIPNPQEKAYTITARY
jgi:hypothetical protein